MTNSAPTASIDAGPFHLRRFFSVTSGLIILALVIMLTFTYRFTEVRESTEQAGQRNEVLARTYANTLWPQFGEFLLGNDLDPDARRRHEVTLLLHQRIAQMSREVPVIKVKVYNRDGVAIYSSVLREIGEDKSANPGFQRALAGERVNELTHRGRISVSEGEIEDVDVVSTYIPIRTGTTTEPLAVFELYSNITDNVARIGEVSLRLFLALWAVFLVLYLSLLAIVSHADRIIRRQYESLKDNEAHLKTKAEELEREILERQEIERALRRSQRQADMANRAKSEFLSSMSHELRTPMNAILGFAQLLDTEPDAPLSPNQHKFLEQISKAGEHLLGLINQVLDLARIESGNLSLSIETISLESVTEECLPLVESLATRHAVQPVRVDLKGLRVQADYIRLKQVLLNLLTNAIKYNRAGGSVSLAAAPHGNKIRIVVTDTGNGIAPELLVELFQPFSRLGMQAGDIEGTGIGLALSKRLVESMEGSIGVGSEVGKGSEFWIDLPVASPATPANGHSGPATGAPEPLTAVLAGDLPKTILYVEDNPANRMLVEEVLHRLPNIRLHSAADAEQGIALAHQTRPDLIILDINLPGMDGFEALKRLRADPRTAHTPAIAVSANAMPHDIERGLAAGFAEYHTKPIQFDALLRTVAEQLEKKS